MEMGFGEASPSHAAKAIGAFPGAEDLADPPVNRWVLDLVDRPVPIGEPAVSFGLAPGPDMGDRDTRPAAAGAHRFAKHGPPIGAVGADVARIALVLSCAVISSNST